MSEAKFIFNTLKKQKEADFEISDTHFGIIKKVKDSESAEVRNYFLCMLYCIVKHKPINDQHQQ